MSVFVDRRAKDLPELAASYWKQRTQVADMKLADMTAERDKLAEALRWCRAEIDLRSRQGRKHEPTILATNVKDVVDAALGEGRYEKKGRAASPGKRTR